MPLMEFYLYPPKYISSAAIAALAPPAGRQPSEAELNHAAKPGLSDQKLALNYANAVHRALHGRPLYAVATSPAFDPA